MENTGKNNLHMVQSNWDEIEKKVREHRMRQIKATAIIIGICLVLGITYYIYMQHKSYRDYRVIQETERTDTAATHFTEFYGNILKYSNDGAAYTTTNNQKIWNQSYEMQTPMVSVCEQYAVLADRGGKEIYVLNLEGLQGKISVHMPILKVEVSSQGTVAVLMEEDGAGHMALYNKKGELLAEGAIHIENGGTPLDIALSKDGKKLGVAVLDVSTGKVQTIIHFYNFGAVGQNKIDNMVATYSYADTVIPQITFVNESKMLAFGDNAVYTFSGADTPKEEEHLKVTQEIKSVFYDNAYFGLVFSDGKNENGKYIKIYDMKCGEVETIHTKEFYQNIRFLDNHEICLFDENQCVIYTLGGLEKFRYEFEQNICEILHVKGYRRYAFVLQDRTQEVRLKLFGKEDSEK